MANLLRLQSAILFRLYVAKVARRQQYGTETNGFSCAIRARMYFNVIWRGRVKPDGNKDEESPVRPNKQIDLY